jgi:hypothetical protein
MTLDDDDIQRIAERVVMLLDARERATATVGGPPSASAREAMPPPSGLVDAATVAKVLGVDRNWVYAHAKQLGGIRLGGPQGRLRFDLARVGDRLAPPPTGAPCRLGQSRQSHPRRHPVQSPRRGACTPSDARHKIRQQTNTAWRRCSATGPAARSPVPMQRDRDAI